MGWLRYNGVTLPFQKTDVYENKVIYTPDGADALYRQVTIQITSRRKW